MKFTVSEIASITSGKIIHNDDKEIEHIFIDSRNAFKPSKGELHDGHHFINKLTHEGCTVFLISDKNFNFKDYPNSSFILVENTVKALQKIASFHRKKFNIPTIAITGSYGKTIVKEWLYELLKDKINIINSTKNYK